MIITKFQGRLGNQMFQYAAALAISKKLKTFCLIDESSNSVFLKYFEIRLFGYDFVNSMMLKLFKKTIKKTIYQIGDEDITEMKKLFINNSYYNGFFQSELYFEGYESYLKNKMVIKKIYKVAFINKYKQLFNDNKIIAIHCRLGDYLNWGSDALGGKNLTLPQSYYKNALSKIDQLEIYKIIIVTDDIKM